MRRWLHTRHGQIALALALAVAVGLAIGPETRVLGVAVPAVLSFIGTLFLNALKMLVVPLVVSSIVVGVAGVGDPAHLGRLGGKTLGYYVLTSLLAILIGLAMVNLLQPGAVAGDPGAVFGFAADTAQLQAQLGDQKAGDLVAVLLRLIPTNVVAAAAEGQLLGLIFFSLLYGFFAARIAPELAQAQRQLFAGLLAIMLRLTDLVLRFAPLGVFALVAKTVADTGLAAFGPLAWFFLTVVLALACHALLVLPLLLYAFGGVDPRRHYAAMSTALLTAFSTASSSATLPVTLECAEKNAGVPRQVSGFVLPLGATVNMDGTALYECVVVLFIAQAYGLELSLAAQFAVVLLALLTSIGVAGIPAASLVAIAMILSAVGLPLEGIGLILAVDRPLDMLRTAVNVLGDSCGAVIVARGERQAESSG